MKRSLIFITGALLALAACDDKPKADDKPAPSSTGPTKASSSAPATAAATTAAPPPATTAAAVASSAAAAAVATGAPAASVSAAATAAAATAGEITYAPYKSASLGFSIDVPSTFKIKPDPKKTEDVAWADDGGASMKVNVVEALETVAETFANDSQSPGVVEKKMEGDHFSISGKNKGKVFFQKSYVVGGKLSTLKLDAPEAQKAAVDAIWARVEKSFKPRGVK